ncbi:14414_t:CDS:1, partial [Gigaspora rosea]
VTETSLTKAISFEYQKLFGTATQYSGFIVFGIDNQYIIDQLYADVNFYLYQVSFSKYKIFIYSIGTFSNVDWHNASPSFCSSLVYPYQKKHAVFVSKILEDECIIELYQNANKIKTFYSSTPSDVWKNSGFIEKFDRIDLFGFT